MPLQRMLLIAALLPGAAGAAELVEGFRKALAADPTYQAAKAEFEVNRLGAERAGRAYWPELAVRAAERSELTGFQTTIQLAQPLVDAERYATWKGAEPLEIRAAATMRQREAELLARHFKAVADVVRAREQLRSNQAKIGALEQQSQAAQRGLTLGTGTKTDVYDAAVRLSVARADALTLRANLEAAQRQYESQTLEPLALERFVLTRERRSLELPALPEVLARMEASNPQIVAAVQAERLAELDVTRKYGALLPRVNAIARQSRIDGGQNSTYVGLAFELPLQSGSLLDVSVARAGLARATEELRATRIRARLEVQRLHELVANARAEIPIRLEAIEAARLGLEASERSFRGGVRTQIDVLNSIQTLYQTEDEYVASVLALGTNYITLRASADAPSLEVLEQLQAYLF